MNEEIGFSEGEKKVTPEVMDAEIKQMQAKAVKQIEQKQVNEQEKIKAGIVTPPLETESVPKEIPYLFFHYGAKALQCPAFETDDEESRTIAKHLSILIGAQRSWLWSLLVILLIVFGKLVQCWGAVVRFFKREKKTELPNEPKDQKITETL